MAFAICVSVSAPPSSAPPVETGEGRRKQTERQHLPPAPPPHTNRTRRVSSAGARTHAHMHTRPQATQSCTTPKGGPLFFPAFFFGGIAGVEEPLGEPDGKTYEIHPSGGAGCKRQGMRLPACILLLCTSVALGQQGTGVQDPFALVDVMVPRLLIDQVCACTELWRLRVDLPAMRTTAPGVPLPPPAPAPCYRTGWWRVRHSNCIRFLQPVSARVGSRGRCVCARACTRADRPPPHALCAPFAQRR
jgi:hypothetical protein